MAYLISKEHFKLSRVALFSHCSFPQACPFKASDVVGVFTHFLSFFHTFLSNFDFSGTPVHVMPSQHSPTCKLWTARHLLSKQTGSLASHCDVVFFWLQSSRWFGRQEPTSCTPSLIFKATSVVPRAFQDVSSTYFF